MLRSAVLNGYVEVAQSVGLSPYPLMRVAGIDPVAFADQTGWLSAQSVDRLLELSSAQSGHADFGIRMSSGRGVSNLGPVGLVAREEPDVRSALGIVLRHMNLHNEAILLTLGESGGLATFRVGSAQGITLGRQSIELVVAAIHRILADLLPSGWRPMATYFAHTEPRNVELHQQEFGGTVAFGREFDGIVLPSTDLDLPNPLANPLFRPFTQEYLGLLAPTTSATVSMQVRDLIVALLPTDTCSVSRIARSLGMDRRTLCRQLAAVGESYSSLLDSVRREHAQVALARRDCSLTETAAELGFSELSSFSRWFRQRFGVSPRAWSKRLGVEASAGDSAPVGAGGVADTGEDALDAPMSGSR